VRIIGVDVNKVKRRATGEKFYIPVVLRNMDKPWMLHKGFTRKRDALAYGKRVMEKYNGMAC